MTEIFDCEGGGTLGQATQRACKWLMPASIQDQAGCKSEQSGLVKVVPVHGR